MYVRVVQVESFILAVFVGVDDSEKRCAPTFDAFQIEPGGCVLLGSLRDVFSAPVAGFCKNLQA